MPTYESGSHSPPAAVARVTIRDITSGRAWADVPMLLDTGADVTLLPRECIDRLQVPIDSTLTYRLRSFDGAESTAIGLHLDLIFLGLIFVGAIWSSISPKVCWAEISSITYICPSTVPSWFGTESNSGAWGGLRPYCRQLQRCP